jgi:LmbE family N-acetylglucosaminyl deacetylase
MSYLKQMVPIPSGPMNLPVASPTSSLNPAVFPVRSLQTITGPVLVVAPHPDDETLGCGGAISLLRASGCAVYVLVISDGTLSHPRSVKYPAPRLRSLREAETLEALAILGVSKTETLFLRLKDGSIPTSASTGIRAAVTRCRTYLEAVSPKTIFLPWRFDPHPDHRATWKLIRTVLGYLNNTPRIIEYPIWDWDPNQGDLTNFEQVVGWRLDVRSVSKTKRIAISAYRSQTTNLIDDDPDGFQLTPEMVANFIRPWELYLEDAK